MDTQKLEQVLAELSDPRFVVRTISGEDQVIVIESSAEVLRKVLGGLLRGDYLDCSDAEDPLCCHVHGHGVHVHEATLDELVEIGELDRHHEVKREMLRHALVAGNTRVIGEDDVLDREATLHQLERISDAELARMEEQE